MSGKRITLYEILNVQEDATEEQITASYRKLARLFHPDRHPDPKQKQEAEELFKKISEAYNILKDRNLRARYDMILAHMRRPKQQRMVFVVQSWGFSFTPTSTTTTSTNYTTSNMGF